MSNKDQHLRWKHRQWTFQRRWPKAVAESKPSKYRVENLGTANLLEARIMRDRLVAEMNAEAFETEQDTAHRLAVYKAATPKEREVLEELWSDEADERWNRYGGPQRGEGGHPDERWSEQEAHEAQEWFRQVTGKSVPLLLNVDRWLADSGLAPTTIQSRREAIQRFAKWSPAATIEEVDRALARRYIGHLLEQG